MTEPRINVKVTKSFNWEEFSGDFDSIISQIQDLKDEWVGVEAYTSAGYDIQSPVRTAFRLYKFREENDKEYKDRMKSLEYVNKAKLKQKRERLKQLKKEISSLSDDDKKLLGL